MNKILTFIIGAVIGALLGGAAIFYFLGGAPTASMKPPGEPIKAPEPGGNPPGTAGVVIDQPFFDAVLAAIFRDMNQPVFPISAESQNLEQPDFRAQKIAFFQNECEGSVVLLPEGSGVKTGIKLENSRISAPLAFRGSTTLFGTCYQFSGWAQAGLNLRYDSEQRTVFGQIEVETVNLDGVTPLVSGIIARFVQASLNQRVNPIVILRGDQIALSLPIAATNGTLNGKVKDVRAEVKENALSLYVNFDFAGTKESGL